MSESVHYSRTATVSTVGRGGHSHKNETQCPGWERLARRHEQSRCDTESIHGLVSKRAMTYNGWLARRLVCVGTDSRQRAQGARSHLGRWAAAWAATTSQRREHRTAKAATHATTFTLFIFNL